MLSLFLGGGAFLIALHAIGASSVLLAVLYGCMLALSGIAILYSFCAKCRCRDTTCGHVIPGMITRYLPRRLPSRYSLSDRIGILLPIAVSLIYPQYWLAGSPLEWAVFWILMVGAAVEMRVSVCPGCTNRYCPARSTPRVEPEKESPGPD